MFHHKNCALASYYGRGFSDARKSVTGVVVGALILSVDCCACLGKMTADAARRRSLVAQAAEDFVAHVPLAPGV